MRSFMSQNIISINFFIDTESFYFTREIMCVSLHGLSFSLKLVLEKLGLAFL